MNERVLIIYNRPTGADANCAASEAGVLDQVHAVSAAMMRLGIGYRVAPIDDINALAAELTQADESIVFNLVEAFVGRPWDAWFVPAMCQALGKSVTGNDTNALLATLDKAWTKQLLQCAGLPSPIGQTVGIGQKIDASQLPAGRLIVKPCCTDASEGIDVHSIIDDRATLNKIVEGIHKKFHQPALIEEFVGSRELNVSLIQRNNRLEVLPLAEIDFSKFAANQPRIVDYSAKWNADSFAFSNTPRMIPAPVDASVAEAIRQAAMRAWQALGCRDYARVDFRLDDAGKFHILEVNANPDISPDAGFAAAVGAGGLAYEEFVATVVENAERRLLAMRSAQGHSPKKSPEVRKPVTIRRTAADDRDGIMKFMAETQFFPEHELAIAAEVLDDAIRDGEAGDYQSFTAVSDEGSPIGWVCYGATPCTVGTYDIYWIGVSTSVQRGGIGSALLDFAEGRIRQQKGRLAIIETSGRDLYKPTQQFYISRGYRLDAVVSDFYSVGDDKLMFVKRL